MPYASNSDLPAPLLRILPPHAQGIYRAASNNAFVEYAARANSEARAHRVAWAAVKRQYRKAGDRWVARAS